MKFVATKTAEQLDLQALHRVRERLVSQRTGIINQIRAFLLERGIAVRQGRRFLRAGLPGILATGCGVLSARMVHLIEDLAGPSGIGAFVVLADAAQLIRARQRGGALPRPRPFSRI